MRRRTRAREVALQALYQADARSEEEHEDILEFIDREAGDDPDVLSFARQLFLGTLEMQPKIDEIIGAAAQNWHMRRMALVDRNVLRMAVYEMIYVDDIPPKVSINEAIEMGKRFSTQQSGSFINGILDRIRRERDL